jgi:hypothetical protein
VKARISEVGHGNKNISLVTNSNTIGTVPVDSTWVTKVDDTVWFDRSIRFMVTRNNTNTNYLGSNLKNAEAIGSFSEQHRLVSTKTILLTRKDLFNC